MFIFQLSNKTLLATSNSFHILDFKYKYLKVLSEHENLKILPNLFYINNGIDFFSWNQIGQLIEFNAIHPIDFHISIIVESLANEPTRSPRL